jgi:thioredoxin-dependent peroxiredoxin
MSSQTVNVINERQEMARQDRTLSFVLLIITVFVVVTAFAWTADQAPWEGKAAPDFTLKSQDGAPITLSQYRGKWVVLYFYPKDFTSGCTIEAHNFQRDLDQYEKKNAVILGVSLDSVDSHKSFCAKEALNFKLLSDSSQEVAPKYNSIMERNGQKYAVRNTFLIDPSGTVVKEFIGVNPNKHSEEVLAALTELESKSAKE